MSVISALQPAGDQGRGGLEPADRPTGGHGESTAAPVLCHTRPRLQAWIQVR